jgi:hypothetical protein
MRYAFTIIYNGKHHLEHGDFVKNMTEWFDLWIVVEGFAHNGGSTNWCNDIKMPGNSTDGTCQLMEQLFMQHRNIVYLSHSGGYDSKDEQVNVAMAALGNCEDGWLWQVDADEHWKLEDIEAAESMLSKDSKIAGAFQFNHYLCKDVDGRQLVGGGNWGDNFSTRLWWWQGQNFITHEPPVMQGQQGVRYLPQKYEHYSYYFEQDVQFKSKYYKGYKNVYDNWKRLQKSRHNYPIPVTKLLGTATSVDIKNSFIDAK